ncbi:MAG TPA: hypothetical protein VGM56_01835 [Byssovorax sp.]
MNRPEEQILPEAARADRPPLDDADEYVEVRESWVGDRPSAPSEVAVEPYVAEVPIPATPRPSAYAPAPVTARPATVPPPLPPPSAHPPPDEAPVSEELLQSMFGRLAASDYDGALRAAESVLQADHRSVDALQARELCRAELRKIYVDRLGDLASIAKLTAVALAPVDLDIRASTVLARVDGISSLATIAATTPGVPEHHALRILSELFVSGAISLA